MLYGIDECPPWYLLPFMGLQVSKLDNYSLYK